MHWEAPCSFPVYYFSRSCSRPLSSTEQKHTFGLGWFMAGFVFVGSAPLTHRSSLIWPSIPILFTQSPGTCLCSFWRVTCLCSFWRLTPSWQGELFPGVTEWVLCCPHRGEGRSHWSLPFQAVQVPAGSCFPLWQVYLHLLQWRELAAAHREAQWTETLQMPTLLLWDQTHRGAGCSPSRWAQGKAHTALISGSLLFANTVSLLACLSSQFDDGGFSPPQIWKLIPCCTSLPHFPLTYFFFSSETEK